MTDNSRHLRVTGSNRHHRDTDNSHHLEVTGSSHLHTTSHLLIQTNTEILHLRLRISSCQMNAMDLNLTQPNTLPELNIRKIKMLPKGERKL